MEEIPTALDFWLLHQDEMEDTEIMIEFTKLHLKAQAEAIIKHAVIKQVYDHMDSSYFGIDEDSVREAYSLLNVI